MATLEPMPQFIYLFILKTAQRGHIRDLCHSHILPHKSVCLGSVTAYKSGSGKRK